MEQWVTLNGSYGYNPDGTWKDISIPLSDFMSQNQYFNVTQLSQLFMLVSTSYNFV